MDYKSKKYFSIILNQDSITLIIKNVTAMVFYIIFCSIHVQEVLFNLIYLNRLHVIDFEYNSEHHRTQSGLVYLNLS